jgi:hypothetical protein
MVKNMCFLLMVVVTLKIDYYYYYIYLLFIIKRCYKVYCSGPIVVNNIFFTYSLGMVIIILVTFYIS